MPENLTRFNDFRPILRRKHVVRDVRGRCGQPIGIKHFFHAFYRWIYVWKVIQITSEFDFLVANFYDLRERPLEIFLQKIADRVEFESDFFDAMLRCCPTELAHYRRGCRASEKCSPIHLS